MTFTHFDNGKKPWKFKKPKGKKNKLGMSLRQYQSYAAKTIPTHLVRTGKPLHRLLPVNDGWNNDLHIDLLNDPANFQIIEDENTVKHKEITTEELLIRIADRKKGTFT